MPRTASEAHYFNPDDATAALKATPSQLVATDVAQSRWTVGSAHFGHVSLWWGYNAARGTATGIVLPGTAIVGLGTDSDGRTINGRAYSRRIVAFLPPGTEYASSFGAPGNFCFMAAPYEWLQSQADPALQERLDPRGIGTFDLGHAAARARAGTLVARNFALHQEEFQNSTAHRAAMEKALVATLFDALDDSDEIVIRSDPRLMRRLVECLHERSGEALCQEDLVAALGTSRRSLRRLFARHFGTTPGTYLRMRRMLLARRALVRGECDSITEAAVRFGFFDLGRFAGTYKLLFGELPSQSMRSTFHGRRRARKKNR